MTELIPPKGAGPQALVDSAFSALSPTLSTPRTSRPTLSAITASEDPKARSASSLSINSSKKQPNVASETVVSILNNMYAHPGKLAPGPTPTRSESSKSPFLHRKINPRTVSATSSHFPEPSNTLSTSGPRLRTLSEDSTFPHPIVWQSTQPILTNENSDSIGGPQPARNSMESESAGRVVGRGGRGSRLRTVVLKHDVLPKLVSLEASTADSPPMSLRPSGRGGLASRPKQLAPPPPPKSPTSKSNLSLAQNQETSKYFIRPSGRGGAGARSSPAPPSLTLRNILDKTKRKPSNKKSKLQRRGISALVHPITSSLADEITNDSTETLSTLHFSGQSTSLPPIFFPEELEDGNNIASGDDFDSTPSFSATASTFEGSVSLQSTGDEDLDINVYLEDSPSPTPVTHQQRSLNKLARTLGTSPYDSTASGIMHALGPVRPKVLIDRQPLSSDKTAKMFRRASLSMTSIFARPSRRRRGSIGIDSQDTIETITDDLHQLGLGDDDLTESWGPLDASRASTCDSPGSPIVFSPPSPSHMPKPQSMPPSLDDVDGDFSVPASTLPSAESHKLSSQKPVPRTVNHTPSISSSLSGIAFSDCSSDIIAPLDWLFPPSADEHDFKVAVTRNLSDKPMPWTGEWNTDMDDVIRTLRELR